jgi:glycosyltransferase involved in cell wall biosynthesis
VRVRPWQLLRALVARGHELTLATISTGDADRADLAAIEALGVHILVQRMSSAQSALTALGALPQGKPLQTAWSWSPSLLQQMSDLVAAEPFDAIHVEHLRGSRYAVALHEQVQQGRALGTPRVVWDSVDSISSLFAQAARSSSSLRSRLVTRLELGATRREERRLSARLPAIVVTSPADKAAFLSLASEAQAPELARRMHIIPNGVDFDEFAFRRVDERAPATVIFSGKLSYHANSTAAHFLVQQVMPLLWRERPDVELRLVGKEPPATLQRLAAELPAGAGSIVVTGAVPSMGAEVGRATVAAAPLLYGAGIQNKVLEAMACGTPVVATTQATAALAAEPGRDLLVAEGAPALARALLSLLDSPEERERMGRAGRAFVEEHHSWPGAAARFEALYAGEAG